MLNSSFFNEITVRLPKAVEGVVNQLASEGVLAGVPMSRLYPGGGFDNLLILAATETVTDEDIQELVAKLTEVLS